MRGVSHEPPGCQRRCAQSRSEPAGERGEPGRLRRAFFHLELEEPRLRIDGLDRAREHHTAAMQETRAEDERGGRAVRRVEHDVFDDPDARPAGSHVEAFRPREPVLENVAAPAEHVRPHVGSVPQPSGIRNLRSRAT